MCQLLDNGNYILMSEKLNVKWLRCSRIGAKLLLSLQKKKKANSDNMWRLKYTFSSSNVVLRAMIYVGALKSALSELLIL